MIAITGGNGPLAKLLTRELLKQGEQVSILTNTEADEVHENLRYVRGDIFDVTSLEELMDNASSVYHLEILDTFRPRVRMDLYRCNVEGTANVVNVARSLGLSKLIFASTIFSLGDRCDVRPFDESSKWSNTRTASGYGWSMHLAEREVFRGISEGLNSIVVHAPIVPLSPAQPSSSSEILNFCHSLKGGYTQGNAHIIDAADLIKVLTGLMDGAFDNGQYIAFGHMLSYREVAERMASYFSRKPPAKEISYISLKRRALYRRINFLTGQNRPMLSKSLAQALSDNRSFSNQKVSQLFATGFIDMDVTLKRYCSLYMEEQRMK